MKLLTGNLFLLAGWIFYILGLLVFFPLMYIALVCFLVGIALLVLFAVQELL